MYKEIAKLLAEITAELELHNTRMAERDEIRAAIAAYGPQLPPVRARANVEATSDDYGAPGARVTPSMYAQYGEYETEAMLDARDRARDMRKTH
jgi:hypothetical protein